MSQELDFDYYSLDYGYKLQKGQKIQILVDRHMGVVNDAIVKLELDELVLVQFID